MTIVNLTVLLPHCNFKDREQNFLMLQEKTRNDDVVFVKGMH